MTNLLKVGLIQMVSGDLVETNLLEAKSLIEEAVCEGAKFVLLPEYFYYMGSFAQLLPMAEEEGKGPIQDILAETARLHQIYLLAGSLPLKSSRPDRVASASLLFSPEGKILARYDKRHLFDITTPGGGERHTESMYFQPGQSLTSANVETASVGLSICYDIRFPEHFRELVQAGANVLTVPAAFTEATGKAHWKVLLKSRAIENQCYVLAPNQAGLHPNGNRTYGHSMVVDPWGKVLIEGPATGSCALVTSLDFDRLSKLRQDFPVLQHRRS